MLVIIDVCLLMGHCANKALCPGGRARLLPRVALFTQQVEMEPRRGLSFGLVACLVLMLSGEAWGFWGLGSVAGVGGNAVARGSKKAASQLFAQQGEFCLVVVLRHNTCASALIFARNQPKQTKDLV